MSYIKLNEMAFICVIFQMAFICAVFCPIQADAESCDWTGVWQTNFGSIELQQRGYFVTGNFSSDGGSIRGSVSDNQLIGTWSTPPTNAPPCDAGDLMLNISDDCRTFRGGFWYGYTSDGSLESMNDWTGSRVQSIEELKLTGSLEVDETGEADLDGYESGIYEGEELLGIVEDGELRLLLPYDPLGAGARLTTIAMIEAVSPESGEINLSDYEGRAVLVSGYNGGGWIYSARIIEVAGPILSAVVLEVFGEREDGLE
jgi:hypothetical protein